MESEDACLSSREIRRLVESGKIYDPCFDESRVQPSSFEPTIGDKVFIIDTDEVLFRPRRDEPVYNTLLRIPKRRRPVVDISSGYETKIRGSYLIPLEQRFLFGDDFRFIKSSPKSSIGRVFPSTRLLTDFSPSFDEALNPFERSKELMMWLLFQPSAFNLILSPGLSLNQLRFTRGFNSQLTSKEILELWKSKPLLYSEMNGSPISNPEIGEKLQIHVDLEGRNTNGIVALRARRNPNPIDLRKKKFYVAEDYFEPVKAEGGGLIIRRGEHYLISSKEVLDIPRGNNVELKSHSHQGISGPLHRAGFVDNRFIGDLVFELTSKESTDLELRDGTPLGELAVFRTTDPDKVYGDGIGSNYRFQRGPKVAKYFKAFDFKMAARDYAKLDRDVLVQDANLLLALREDAFGFEFISDGNAKRLVELVEKKGFFHSRYDCEDDELVLQIIPYVLGFTPGGMVFSYVRAKDIKKYGEKKLFGKHSLGLGGHIVRMDGPDFIRKGLEREVYTEEVRVSGKVTEPRLFGTLYQPSDSVGRVHFGMVYGVYTDGEIVPREDSISSGRMIKIEDILQNSDLNKLYEIWSKVLIPYLSKFYDVVSKNL